MCCIIAPLPRASSVSRNATDSARREQPREHTRCPVCQLFNLKLANAACWGQHEDSPKHRKEHRHERKFDLVCCRHGIVRSSERNVLLLSESARMARKGHDERTRGQTEGAGGLGAFQARCRATRERHGSGHAGDSPISSALHGSDSAQHASPSRHALWFCLAGHGGL